VTAVLDWLAADVTRANAVAGLLRRCAGLLAADVAGQLQPVRDFLLFAGLDSYQARLILLLYLTQCNAGARALPAAAWLRIAAAGGCMYCRACTWLRCGRSVGGGAPSAAEARETREAARV
jgi:hypothetical protein